MTTINALNNAATYTVTLTCRSMRNRDIYCKEYVTYRSLLAAKELAAKIAVCMDVVNVDVTDDTTGEIMWCYTNDGETYEAET